MARLDAVINVGVSGPGVVKNAINKAKGKPARLVRFPDTPYEEYPQGYKNYIVAGEARNEHVGYKCSIRDRWYIVPSVWVPDAFFLRRNNLYPKFVLNRCGAVSTDTMHRMKFKNDVELAFFSDMISDTRSFMVSDIFDMR